MITLSEAIWSLRPNSEFTYKNDDYATIEWHVIVGNPPTAEEIKAAALKLEKDAAESIKKAEADKAALLEKLGITADEAALLIK